MANDYRKSLAAVNAEANALAPLLNAGKLILFDSTMPDGSTGACSTQAQIVTLTFNTTAFITATSGVLTANAITAGNSTFSSTAAFFRAYGPLGSTVYLQGSVGTAAADLILNAIQITSGATVSVSSFVHTVPTS
jgi:hypothetical protein